MILTDGWMNKYEQYVRYIPDNSKVNKKYFPWTALQSWGLEWGGKRIPQGDNTGKEGVEGSRRSGGRQIHV